MNVTHTLKHTKKERKIQKYLFRKLKKKQTKQQRSESIERHQSLTKAIFGEYSQYHNLIQGDNKKVINFLMITNQVE